MRLTAVRRLVCRPIAGSLVSRHVTRLRLFPGRAESRRPTVRWLRLNPASSFQQQISSSEFLRHSLPPRAFRPELTARVLCPLHDITGRVHHHGALQVPASLRPQVLTTSRRFSPRSGLQACFIPQPCPGFQTVQGLCFPRTAAHPHRMRFYPHAVVPHCAHPACAWRPRNGALDFEVLLRARMRTITAVFNRRGSRSPPRFPSPPGAPFLDREPRLPRVIRS